jgi:hypothetical protein
VVSDEGWAEVFLADDGSIAIVYAAGSPYPRVLDAALAYPHGQDEDGELLTVPSRQLSILVRLWMATARAHRRCWSSAGDPYR